MKLITVCNKVGRHSQNAVYVRFDRQYFELCQNNIVLLTTDQFVRATANPKPKYSIGDACLINLDR